MTECKTNSSCFLLNVCPTVLSPFFICLSYFLSLQSFPRCLPLQGHCISASVYGVPRYVRLRCTLASVMKTNEAFAFVAWIARCRESWKNNGRFSAIAARSWISSDATIWSVNRFSFPCRSPLHMFTSSPLTLPTLFVFYSRQKKQVPIMSAV